MGVSHARGDISTAISKGAGPREHGLSANKQHHEAAYRRYREGYDEQIIAHRAEYGEKGASA